MSTRMRFYFKNFNQMFLAALMTLSCVDEAHHVDVNGNETFKTIVDQYWDALNVDYNQAQHYADTALIIAKQLRDSTKIVKALRLSAIVALSKGDLHESQELTKRTLQLAQNHKLEDEQKYLLLQLGVTHTLLANYELGLKYLYQTLALREKNGNAVELATAYQNIGLAYYKLRDNEKAIDFYSRILTLGPNIDSDLKKNAYINLSLAHCELGNYDDALENLKRVEMQGSHAPSIEMSLLFANGVLKMRLGRFLEADKYFFESLDIARKVKDNRFVAEGLVYRAKVLSKIGRYEEASLHLTDCAKLAERHKFHEILLDVYRQQWQQKNIDTMEITAAKSNYMQQWDTIYKSNLIGKLALAEVEFEEAKNIEIIGTQNEILALQAESINIQQRLSWMGVIILCLFLLISAALFNNGKRKMQMHKELDEIVNAKTKDLELQCLNAMYARNEMDHHLKALLRRIISISATAQGLSNLGKSRGLDDEKFQELEMNLAALEGFKNDLNAALRIS